MEKEPFHNYYRVCMIVALVVGIPFSLPLIYRLYKVHIAKQPAIYPECDNFGLALGKLLLSLSKVLLVFAAIVIFGTIILALTAETGGSSGVPAGLAIGFSLLAMLLAVALIEVSQINFRKKVLLSTNKNS